MSATEAQNNFGRVLDQAALDGVVYITKYERPTAVVLSIDKYNDLTGAADVNLDELTRDFDELLAGMQATDAVAGLDALFAMSEAELATAAAHGARPARRSAGRGVRRTGNRPGGAARRPAK